MGSTKEEGEVTPDKTKEPEGDKTHPLESRWTLWFDNPNGKKQQQSTWGSTLRAVYTFGTVEDFWRLYNNIVAPSRLLPSSDLHLFKDGVEPKWEDPKCEHGGKWTVLVPKGNKAALDTMWLRALLACIGEQFNDGDEICGMVVNVRKGQDRISVWTKSAANEAVQVAVGKQIKEFLDIPDNIKVGFLAHQDAKRDDRRAKDRYTV